MDNDFASKLQAVLSNPDAMAKITAVASSLGAQPTPQAEPTQQVAQPTAQPTERSGAFPTNAFLTGGDPRLALLSSLKPLLNEQKRDRVDSLLNALTVATMLKSFRK